MIRRHVLKFAGAALVALLAVGAGSFEAGAKVKAGCSCCGASCACPTCSCDSMPNAAEGCACCGGPACCASSAG